MNLENLLIQSDPTDQVDDAWRVTYAFRICDDLLLGVDVYDGTGRLYCGAVKLQADGKLDWFALFEDLGGNDAFLLDATESGEFLIATGDFDAHPQGSLTFNPDATISVWNPATGTTHTLPTPVEGGQTGWYKRSSISDNGTAFIGGDLYDYDLGNDEWSLIDLPAVDTTLTPADLAADGTAVAAIAGAQIKRNRTGPSLIRALGSRHDRLGNHHLSDLSGWEGLCQQWQRNRREHQRGDIHLPRHLRSPIGQRHDRSISGLTLGYGRRLSCLRIVRSDPRCTLQRCDSRAGNWRIVFYPHPRALAGSLT